MRSIDSYVGIMKTADYNSTKTLCRPEVLDKTYCIYDLESYEVMDYFQLDNCTLTKNGSLLVRKAGMLPYLYEHIVRDKNFKIFVVELNV